MVICIFGFVLFSDCVDGFGEELGMREEPASHLLDE